VTFIAVTAAVVSGLLLAGRAESAAKPVVPLHVQQALEQRATLAAYVPTELPPGYRYLERENLSRFGFDLYFACCGDQLPFLGFDALVLRPNEACSQGSSRRVFRFDRIVVHWASSHNDQEAWRCIRHGRTRVLLTVTGRTPRTGVHWRTPRQLARMVASARPIR
jgi:hypothetical protein